MNDILILALPLNKKDISALNFPGVYFFVKETSQQCQELFFNMQNRDNFFSQCSIVYIGKAKKIRQRIFDYNVFLKNKISQVNISQAISKQKPSHENIKKNRLGIICRTLIIQRFSTHFEACFEEITYIKKFLPIFNKKLKSIPKFCFIESNSTSLQINYIPKKKLTTSLAPSNSMPQIFARKTKKFIFNFSTLISLIKILEKNSKISHYKFDSFGLKKNYTYQQPYPIQIDFPYHQPYCLQDEVKKLLEGKKNVLIQHVFFEMKNASQLQNYHEAVLLRDLYFCLRSLKNNIFKSIKLWNNYSSGNFTVQSNLEIEEIKFKFNYIKKEIFMENYEKTTLVYLWLKNKWENSRWEKVDIQIK